MNQPEQGNTKQHIRDLQGYKASRKANSTPHAIKVSFVVDDHIGECEELPNTHAIWAHLWETYGVHM